MNKEVHKVIHKADEFYEDAQYLFKGKRFEATVNRCYYTMFTSVQALLLSKNAFSKTHQGAQMKFNELFIKTKLLPLELGKMLNDAFEKRQFGDYDVDAEISESDAMKLLENARMFLDKIKLYLMT
jgi:uncharacterized protein (UPF0332 family)